MRGAIESAAAHVEFRLLRHFERHGLNRAVRLARMHAGETLALLLAEREAGVLHAERRKNMIVQICIEAFAARCLH